MAGMLSETTILRPSGATIGSRLPTGPGGRGQESGKKARTISAREIRGEVAPRSGHSGSRWN
jgi:hypothetical protein